MQSNKIKYIIVKTSGFFAKIVGIVATLFIIAELYRYFGVVTLPSWSANSSDYRLSSSIYEAFVIFGMLAIIFVTFGYAMLIDILKDKKILEK